MTLDRTGEPVDDMPERNLPPCICDGSKPGFRGYDSDKIEPCPRHKPHLQRPALERRIWGTNPDARPHTTGGNPSGTDTRAAEAGQEAGQ